METAWKNGHPEGCLQWTPFAGGLRNGQDGKSLVWGGKSRRGRALTRARERLLYEPLAGVFVYRLGRGLLKAERGVRFPYALPTFLRPTVSLNSLSTGLLRTASEDRFVVSKKQRLIGNCLPREGEGSARSQPSRIRSDRLANSKSGRGLRALWDASARSENRQRKERGQTTNSLGIANPPLGHQCPNGRFIGTNNITKKADWFS